MKSAYCRSCGILFSLPSPMYGIMKCKCGTNAGKYLNDGLTAVFTKDSIIIGIDNNTWLAAIHNYLVYREYPSRVDFYFCGWVPTKPGEVIFVNTVEEVENYPMGEKQDAEEALAKYNGIDPNEVIKWRERRMKEYE